MINHSRKYIFVHIPKTAGTSIERALLKHEGVTIDNSIYPLSSLSLEYQRQYQLVVRGSTQHWPLSKFSVGCQKEYFCFTFVRNPWDLMVSEFLYRLKTKGTTAEIQPADADFQRKFKRFIRFGRAQRYHRRPQHRFINERMDFIGRFESLEEDFYRISKRIGLGTLELPHSNPTSRGQYWDYYDDASRALVHKKFRRDIDQFGYTFGE